MNEHWDAIVIGGGAAGLSAALMLGRSRRRTLVVDAGLPRNRFAAHMHGVLGHEGIDPADLLRRGREELSTYDVSVRDAKVARLDETERVVEVHLESGETLTARAAIVATGITDELPALPGLAERWGSSVLHCPYCHGWEVGDKRLAVLTTSPLGMHHALLIRQWSDDLTVFTAGLGEMEEADRRRLEARGITLVDEAVVEVLGEGDQVTGVRTEDGRTRDIDAIFTAGDARPHDGFLAHLGLERADTPVGSFLAVDPTGRTSSDRIWAVGNITNPMANVPVSMGAGAMTGAAVNMALVEEDFERSLATASYERAAAGIGPETTPVDFWEDRYAGSDRVWSGKVNTVLGDIAAGLEPGTALDLGCGEGSDVVWLARNGWQATGMDISSNAIAHATEAAREAGLTEDQAGFVVSDLATLNGAGSYDLVTASFFHSPVELPRTQILRRAAGLVSPGGHFLLTSHAAAPPWADAAAHEHRFLDAEQEVAELDLPESIWETVVLEHRHRPVTSPDGAPASLEDSVVLLRRRP